MTAAAERPESPLVARLREHLGAEPNALPSTVAEFSPAEHANLQLGLDAVAGDAEVIGFSVPHMGFQALGLAELQSKVGLGSMVTLGPVQYTDVEVGDGRVVQCVSAGIFLARHRDAPIVLVLSRGQTPMGGVTLRLEGTGVERGAIPAFLADL